MAAVAKGVTLSFGLMSATVSVHNALEPETKTSNRLVCTGIETEHAPTPITQVNRCGECDDVVPYTALKKAQEVDGGWVIVTADEIQQASVDAVALKKRASLTPHPTEQVDLTTTSGGKLYYLTPDPGNEPAYDVIRGLVEAHPELTFMALWTPRSRAGQFALKVKDDVLVWQERTRASKVRPAPQVTAEAPEVMHGMAEQVLGLEGVVSDYDPSTYEDTFEEKIREIVASKTPLAGAAGETITAAPTPAGATAGMDALAAMLAQAQGTGRKTAKKPAKKKVAKTA